MTIVPASNLFGSLLPSALSLSRAPARDPAAAALSIFNPQGSERTDSPLGGSIDSLFQSIGAGLQALSARRAAVGQVEDQLGKLRDTLQATRNSGHAGAGVVHGSLQQTVTKAVYAPRDVYATRALYSNQNTYAATVTGTNPTGSVTFKNGGSAIAGCVSVALTGSGNTKAALCTTSFAATGTYSIGASYSGDGTSANPPSASSPLSEVVKATRGGGG